MPTPMVADRILQAQVAALYNAYAGAFFVSLAVAASYAALYAWLVRDPRIWWWLGLRLLSLAFYRRLTAGEGPPSSPEAARQWLRLHVAAFIFHGFVWGLVPWLFTPAQDFEAALLTTLLLMMLCAGGLPSVVPRWSAVLALVLPVMLSLVAALAVRAQDLRFLFLAFCGALYVLMVLRAGYQHHRLLTESLLVRFENQALTERLAEQVRAAQRANEEKTRFLAAASHDLRQPVHAIGLFGAVIEKNLQTHPMRANAEHLMRAVGALGASLDAMLDVSQLDAGTIMPTFAATPLNPVFQSLNQMFSAQADERQLQLRLRATPLGGHTDPVLLLRLLANLVDNAIKYTERGGVLVVARDRGSQVWIDVVDTGVGIARPQQAHVFEEFYQVGNPGRDRSRGLGMGLSIVRRLSRLLEHDVVLHSRPGHGSRFRLVLPSANVQAPARSEAVGMAPDAASPGGAALPGRVLLVDDEEDIGAAMQALLASFGVDLTWVGTAAQARAALARADKLGAPFDVVVCDMRLAEDGDGFDLALELRAERGEALPMLLITGETNPAVMQRVHAAGLRVLFKPVDAHALARALAQAVAKKPARTLADAAPLRSADTMTFGTS